MKNNNNALKNVVVQSLLQNAKVTNIKFENDGTVLVCFRPITAQTPTASNAKSEPFKVPGAPACVKHGPYTNTLDELGIYLFENGNKTTHEIAEHFQNSTSTIYAKIRQMQEFDLCTMTECHTGFHRGRKAHKYGLTEKGRKHYENFDREKYDGVFSGKAD